MSISKINDAFFLLNIQCIKHQQKKKNTHEKMIKEFVKRLKSQSCLGVTKGYADSIFFSFFFLNFFLNRNLKLSDTKVFFTLQLLLHQN